MRSGQCTPGAGTIIKRVPTLRYGPHRQHVVDLDVPPGGGPFPVALVLHGGFWRGRYRRDLMAGLCADLVARGWATANVEYRRLGLRGGRGGVPRTLEDVGAALDHLADVDAPLDLARVVSIGHSAGGHLALWLTGPRADGGAGRVRLAGAVGQAAVSDLEQGARTGLGAGVVGRFCGGEPDAVPAVYALASPAARLPAGVPLLLVHGEADDTVPASMSREFGERARVAGDEVALVVRAGEGHMEHIDPVGGAWREVTTWLQRF
jgi:acetyl esterase/lipase